MKTKKEVKKDTKKEVKKRTAQAKLAAAALRKATFSKEELREIEKTRKEQQQLKSLNKKHWSAEMKAAKNK